MQLKKIGDIYFVVKQNKSSVVIGYGYDIKTAIINCLEQE